MFHEAFLAGIWGSAGSALGKLAGTESVVGDSYAISGVILIIMVLVNTWSSRHYLRSLDAAPNSVAPTVISAASSYVLSGFIGIVLFEEPSSTQWWAGAILIIMGLTLIARPKDRDKFT
ncbi:transmembrane protein 42 isoform X2 [Bombyx mori]|uniref:Transmembrane protein 42 n=1 Tax=Bombyx mori TaxID=7091 RepID=A0A8R1WKH4_BOMMO|nr:transmembrane protein 42 isoform X2 [Bombyx mori]